jgi:hypothetical protein
VATFKNASPELILLLVQRGADREAVIKSGKSVYDFAKEKPKTFDQPDLVELLKNPSAEIRPYASTLVTQRATVGSRPSSRPLSVSSTSSRYSAASVVSNISSSRPETISPVRPESMHSTQDPIGDHSRSVASSEDPLAPSQKLEKATVDSSLNTAAVVDSPVDQPEIASVHVVPSETSVTKSADTKYSVFIGFSSDEKVTDKVQSLVKELSHRGISVYADLQPSSTQSKLFQVSKELEEASVFIACVTSEYMYRVMAGSLEAAFFDIHAQEFTEAMSKLGEKFMIPVVLDPALLERKLWKGPVGALMYNSTQIVDFSQLEHLTEAVDELEKRLYDLAV